MKPFALLLSLVPTVGLVACVSYQLYTEPNQGQTARVRFSTNIDAITMVWTYADEACMSDEQEWMRLKKGHLFNSSPKRLGMPLWEHHENGARELRVLVTPPRTFLFKGSVGSGNSIYTCGVAFQSTFLEGKDYEVAYSWYSKGCNVDVYEIVEIKGDYSRKRIAYFDNRVNQANSKCLSQFRKARLY
jgi:hypothetical protein